MPEYITSITREWIPELIDTGSFDGVLAGKNLHDALDALATEKASTAPKVLNKEQVAFRKLTYQCKWAEGAVMPMFTLACHRMACVASNSPPGSLHTGKSVLANMYEHRTMGLVFGGLDLKERNNVDGALASDVVMVDGAPKDAQSINDATFNRNPNHDVCGILVTYACAAVMHKTHLFRSKVGSSHEGESIASVEGSDFLTVVRDICRGLGDPQDGPSFLGTDNLANALIAADQGNATRSRHFLRRYYILHQRVKAGEIIAGHVLDVENPADFLTKWTTKEKVNESVQYLTNSRAIKGGAAKPCIRPLEVSVLERRRG
jgi:hypothetical protein